MILKEVMDVNEACDKWGLTRSTIKRKCANGRIRAFKWAGRWIIYKDQMKPTDERRLKNGTQV